MAWPSNDDPVYVASFAAKRKIFETVLQRMWAGTGMSPM
jgi:hypothetical protein